MSDRATFARLGQSFLFAVAALALFAAPLATPARALSQLQPAPTAEEGKKPAKPGPGGSGGSGVDEGDDAGGAQPVPPADGNDPAKPEKPASPGGVDDGDDGGGQPAPPGGNNPAPPAGGDQPAPPPAGGGGDDGDDGDAPAQPGTPPAPPADDEGGNAGGGNADDPARPPTDENGPVPEINYDVTTLPQPVKRMRELIIEACKSGDLQKLSPLIGKGESATRLSFDESETDPIEILKQSSGDEDGQEILAILLEVLEAGFVHLDAGTDRELYVWPYFFAVPLDKLDAPQRVELFKLITAGDYEDMKGYGAYIFYRVGISPEGKWEFFIAGD